MAGTNESSDGSASLKVKAGQMAWELAPECVPIFVGPDGLRLDQWLAAGQAQVVKEGADRTVYRVDLPDRAFYVKHYKSPHFARASSYLVRASAPRREWRKAHEIASRDIPTIRPLAVCERRKGGLIRESYFVSEALADTYPLDEFLEARLPRWPEDARAWILRQIVREGARLCARLHRAGVWHDDFHAGNILLHVESSTSDPSRPEVRLALIDVPGVRFSGPLNWRRSRANLAALEAGLCRRFPLSLRWRFLKIYSLSRDDIAMPAIPKAAIEIKRVAIGHGRRILRSRDKRCLSSNRDFHRLDTPGGRVYAVRGIATTQLTSLADHPERLLHSGLHRPAKGTDRSEVVETTLSLSGLQTPVMLKKHCHESLFMAFLRRIRRSRALAAWQLGHALLARDIPTPRPLVVSEPRGRWFARDSYLATQHLVGAVALDEYRGRLASMASPDRELRVRQLAQSVGALIGRMHAAGISHRRLNVDNLLVAQRPESVDVLIVDLDGIRIRRTVSSSIRSREMSRLASSAEAHRWLTRTTRLRLLRSYLAQFPLESRDWKPWWRRIARQWQA